MSDKSTFYKGYLCIIQTQLQLVSMRRTSKKKTTIQTVEEYASSTSIHGISHIFDREGAQSLRFFSLHILSQGAHLSGPVLVDGGRSQLPGACCSPHLQHVDPMAGPSGENNFFNTLSVLVVKTFKKEAAERLRLIKGSPD